MNIAIVGFGNAGKNYCNLLLNNREIEKIYIIDDKVRKKNKDNIKFTTFENVKKNKIHIDYAFICSPSGLHFKHAKFFLNLKANVLIEKPFVLNLKHANELIKLSDKFKTKCWTALQNRHNPSTIEFRKYIKNNKVGKINLVDCSMYWRRDKKYYSNGWRGKYKMDGGVLSNQAIHLLDILINTFGEIKKFNVLAGFNKKKLEAEDLISIIFLHKNGIFSSLKATTRANDDYKSAIDAIGEKGRCLVSGISLNTFNIYKDGKPIKIKKYSENYKLGLGPISGMGFGHKKILDEFLNQRVSSQNLEIKKNTYVLKLIHSIYNAIQKKKNYNKVKNFNSELGFNEKK